MKIAIVGAGLMGLALAQQLSNQGHDITVFEREKQLGGLTTYHNYGQFYWDRFYHVILPSDVYLIQFLQEIGLKDELCWFKTRTGFYVDEKFFSLSNSWEFLMFPALPFFSKLRLALTILYCAKIKDWERLEQVTVEDWLLKTSGTRTFNKLWKPLLLAKLGEHYKRVSAVFIWSYIKRVYSARDASAKKETLGYVSGGYKTVFDRLKSLIISSDSKILTDVSIDQINPSSDRGLWVSYKNKKEKFDKVIYTGPVNILKRLVSNELLEFQNNNQEVEYLGVICMVLITKKPLVPYYVLNIADDRIPFTGIIGMSNLVSLDETNNLHITYLPKYIHSEDPILRQSDEDLQAQFFSGLKIMFPQLTESNVVSVHINRAIKVQPLQVINYSKLAPKVTTKNKDFFVLNTSQFVNNTLNNNEVIRAVSEFLNTTDFTLN